MIREALKILVYERNLSFSEAELVFKEIFEKKTTSAQVAAFLTALTVRGEREEEISAAAEVIRQKARKVKVRNDFVGIEDSKEVVFDTCGTGGSGKEKFNISTAVAFLVSAAGVKVAKHGNRSMSSSCGSADVLEALGIKIDASPYLMQKAIKNVGIGFLYAPLYHPALKEVAQIRKEMGMRTVFNILGPLCNPASASHQLLGVYRKELVPVIASVLRRLGVQGAFVVHSKDLGDEVSLGGPTYVAFLNKKRIRQFTLRPSDFGLKKVTVEALEVKNVKESAQYIRDIFKGRKGPGRDVVLANASCCFSILGKAKTFKEGVALGEKLLKSGSVEQKFISFQQFLKEEEGGNNE